MSKHDELCEKADVGSLCDCACAGSKHAVKHTRGGVPGAGSVSKRAQGLASKDGRAAVVNNRAVAKPGAPSTKRPTPAMDAKTGEKYEAVKKYDDAGKMVDRANGRRYDVVKKPLGGDAGPKDATAAELAAAEKAGKAVQMHRRNDAGVWAPEGEPGSVKTKTTMARNAIDHHGQAGRIRLTVTDNPAPDAMTVSSRRRGGETSAQDVAKPAAVPATGRDKSETVKSSARGQDPVDNTKPAAAVKVPTALRDINDVIDNPGAHLDQNAAARYQKLTREHMALMSPERKQAMLDDIVARAKGYKPKSPTGQKLARAHSALVHQSSQHKEGMTASMVNRATAADQVTHPEHGHGRVKSTEYGGDGTTVDFGDKTVTVKQGSLVFGHTPGADTNPDAKAKAADAKQAARTAANNAKLMSFAADPSLSNFNTVSGYAPESFKALPVSDQAKMVTALKDLRDRHGSIDVKRRVAETLKKWGA